MSVIFQTLLNTQKICSLQKSLKYPLTFCKCLNTRRYSDTPKKFITFDEVVAQRRTEARRSLVVQVNAKASFNELYAYCSKYTDVKGVHHYKNSGGEHFMLIEFMSEDNVKDVLENCSLHQKDPDIVPIKSPFLWFKAAPEKKEKLITPKDVSLVTEDGASSVDEDQLIAALMQCNTVSDQIQTLYDRTILNDIGVRLRYMVARQLEMVLASLFSNIEVRPFGSSVNGFGKIGCDLDLVVTNNIVDETCGDGRRLVFQERGGGRAWARQLECVAGVLEARLAGAARVTRVLHARVPILKYAHDHAGLHCDLTYNSTSGLHMSELLWLAGALAPGARALALGVRRWAAARALTSPHAGRWITNFPLTLLVLFFLQQRAALPPLDHLVRRARKVDTRITEDGLNCTFLRDLNELPAECLPKNTSNLETLLLQFFEFYSQFDFEEKAISINEGVAVRKPNNQPLYIVNPLDKTLNVSKNVSYEECERLRMEVRNAAWQLESVNDSDKVEGWGLLGLTEKPSMLSLRKLVRVGNSHRLVSLKDLFKEDSVGDEPKVENLGTKLDSVGPRVTSTTDKVLSKRESEMKIEEKFGKKSSQEPKIKYKNTQVRNEVYRIRRNKMA